MNANIRRIDRVEGSLAIARGALLFILTAMAVLFG